MVFAGFHPGTWPVSFNMALVHFDGLNEGRMLFSFFGPDRPDAA